MFRLPSLAILVAVPLAAAGTAHAQSQAEIAERLNSEGKEQMLASNYPEAAKKFQEAVARVPEPKYFFNLCVARANEGRFDEAITACNAVDLNNPTAELKGKTEKMVAKIQDMAKTQGVELHPEGSGGGAGGGDVPPKPDGTPTSHQPPPTRVGAADPSGPPPTTPRYAPPPENLALGVRPDNKYTWTLGFDLFGGAGRVGQPDAYGTTMGGIRVKGDYLFDPIHRIGTQVYLQVSHLGQGSDDALTAETLDIFDFGIAAYKHACLGSTPRLCVTPLIGAHVSLMSPANEMDETGSQVFNYAGVGARGELAFTYAFGPRYEHALSLAVGANVYSKVLSGPSAGNPDGNLTIGEAGLDKAGALAYFGLGYTYRFNTPLGTAPFVTLE